jgi:transcriptional regulator with XRE-family HTH domain
MTHKKNNFNLKSIGMRIKQLRIKTSMTQQELSSKINIPRTVMSNYENGLRTPNLEILIMLSKIFNCSLDYLVNGTEVIPEGSYDKQKASLLKILDKLSLKEREIVIDLAKKLKNK